MNWRTQALADTGIRPLSTDTRDHFRARLLRIEGKLPRAGRLGETAAQLAEYDRQNPPKACPLLARRAS